MELRLSEFEIDRVINAQCDLVRTLAEEKNSILWSTCRSICRRLIRTRQKIQQILTNLLSNATQIHAEGGRITLSRPAARRRG